MAKSQIKNYTFKPGIGALDYTYPDAYNLLNRNRAFLLAEATAWIDTQVAANVLGFIGYTFNEVKCQRDLGYVLDAYLNDLRYGGNEKTRKVISYYWEQDVAQVDGDRIPEIQTHGYIGDLITDYIFTNTAAPQLGAVSQVIDLTKTSEAAAFTKIDELVNNTVSVITNGLSSLPTLVPTGVGTIKIQGKHPSSDILLITNTTKNEIIYNFSNPATGGTFTIKDNGTDEDFATYLQTTDGVTTIEFNYNTSSHSSTDDIQIFIEEKEVRTRPYDFGTDAIERNRIAAPMSMLDADFEYGLQPTKWSAIATMRGYPSVYEVPGTDTAVLSVETDASEATEGVGQSLITVTTVSVHGFLSGTPITIKALANSIAGASRAEGSFVINAVPTPTTFTFYAKAKVGTTAGQILSTTYTQLRQAAFYTGADIGGPEFTVVSQGSSGALVSELINPTGTTILAYDGPSPEVGSPLVLSSKLASGTQVTSIIDTSAGGGTYITPVLVGEYGAGTTTVTVEDAAGIVLNLAVDRGDGVATYIEDITDNDITFSQPFVVDMTGNTATYTSILATSLQSSGAGLAVTISGTAGVYSVDAITNGGTNYSIGDRVKIEGNLLGGATPDNDLILSADGVSGGVINSLAIESGVAFDGTASFTNYTAPATQGNQGSGARFDITYENNVYTSVTLTSGFEGTGYAVNDIVKVSGGLITPLGEDPANDILVTVTGIGVGGAISTVTYSGIAPDAEELYNNPNYTASASGSGITFTVTRTGDVYNVAFAGGGGNGVGFIPTETISIVGTELGGASPANDLTITVDNVGGSGEITAYTVTGTAINAGSRTNLSTTLSIGISAIFDISVSGGSYFIDTIVNGGTNYGAGQTFLIVGTALIGTSPANDLTITINTVDSLGTITSVTPSGTAISGDGTFTGVSPINMPVLGNGASFNIVRSNSSYSVSLSTPGTNYTVGNRLSISGTVLGGTSPLNDILITVVTEAGGEVSTFTESWTSAVPGMSFDLISTVLITEPTINTILKNDVMTYSALPTLQIAFPNAHGLVPGDTFIVTTNSDNGVNNHTLAEGSFFATEIPNISTIRYTARAPGAIDVVTNDISGSVYPRPDSFFTHRPFDGGVQLGTGGPQHGAQAIRQSKKYIRYQSGKGIMYTTGALFAPSYDLRSVTADGIEVGALITIETDDNDHGVQVGGIIRLIGISTPGYNSGSEAAVPPHFDYEVVDVVDERRFRVRSQRRLGSTTAELGFAAQMSVVSWHGATVRSGIFDDQNGIFWEYDGTNISVNQRTGTKQVAGTITVATDSNYVTGSSTRFTDQLKSGDRVIIKGMTHVVSHVISDSAITVTPDYRGVVDATSAKMMLVVDKKVKQADFNLDRLDGTGPSGYNIDIAKMQMIGIQYSWYGAGFIDFMLRGSDGNFVFCHRMRNSNVNTEAFMRSGNLPVRYEVTNEGPLGQLAENISEVQTTIPLVDGSFFPDSGTVYINNEIITFTGRSENTLTGCTRSATFTNFQAGADRSYTAGPVAEHSANTGVILISQTITPLISHWGSAFLTDGGFDEDRGYIFSYAATGISISTTKTTAFMIRLAPSVSNAITGDLGERELLNRAQLLLQGLEITSDTGTGGIVVQGVLNPQNYPTDPGSVSWSGLSGVAQGGQPSFAQIAPGGAINWNSGASLTTTTVASSATIDTATYTPLVNGTGENNSPIEILTSVYNGVGAAYIGADIYSVNPSTVYSGGSQGTYRVTNIRTNGDQTLIDFVSTTGRTQRATNWSGTPGIFFRQPAYTGFTNRLIFAKAAWEAGSAAAGTSVSTTDTNWPAGTAVSSVTLKSLGGIEFYEVQFNQTSITSLSSGASVIFEFGQPPFALPGETVFSFIAVPGERSTLDLSQLKELTNTPLGGRGTFPNGPDILAINVYKISGTAVNSNIIVRWGEAQA